MAELILIRFEAASSTSPLIIYGYSDGTGMKYDLVLGACRINILEFVLDLALGVVSPHLTACSYLRNSHL